ncbi:MAG TPA: sugar ABC transporter substrate-binding protein [Armatimonadota bacterium]|jgi:multiple sugar transport system substrate-binding protein
MSLTRSYILAFAAALLASGCGERPRQQPGVVTLSFYNYASPEFLDLYNKKLIPAFERAHPGVKVVMNSSLGDNGYDAKLLTLIAGGIAPDLFHVTQQNFPFYPPKGILLPLDRYIREDPGFRASNYYPQVMDGLRWKGQTLGLPSDFSTIVILYNKDLFDRYRVPYPKPNWTWADFLAACRALTHDTDKDGHTDVFGFSNPDFYNRWPAWVWMNGGEIMTPDLQRCTMDTPEAIGGLKFYMDLSATEHVAPTPGQSMGQEFEDLFASKTVAMIADSRFCYKRFLKGKGLPFRWDLAPMPRGKRQATTFIWGGNCILRSTKHPKEAWEFLKFLSGPEGARINQEAGNALPAYRPAAEAIARRPVDPKTPEHDIYFLEAVRYGRTAPFPPQIAEFNAAADNMHDAFLGLKPVDAACRDFTKEVNDAVQGKVF